MAVRSLADNADTEVAAELNPLPVPCNGKDDLKLALETQSRLLDQNANAVGSFDYWHRLQEIQELQDRDCVLAISQQLKKILC